MKLLYITFIFCFIFNTGFAQVKGETAKVADTTQKIVLVEASCGTCKLGLSGDDCALAVRIAGVSYFLDGAHIDSFGDAHSDDGFCNAIRKAKVQGKVVNDRFVATSFVLLPEKQEKK
jgi:hypothetical protein